MTLNIISLGAGVQSTTMALMAAHGEIEPMPDCAIFADTKAEPHGVYQHLDWLERQLPFKVHRVSKGNLREDILHSVRRTRIAQPPFFTGEKLSGSNYFVPGPARNAGNGGMLRRQCTREYKVEPIEKKVRELVGLKPRQRATGRLCEQWIGISTDEAARMKPARVKWIENRFPLIEQRMSRWDCLRWLERNGYPQPEKSACTFCPYHDDARWREMKQNDPVSFADAVMVDEAIRDGVRGTANKLYIHRSLTPLADVDFSNAEDRGQLNMFNEECEGMCGV